MIKQLFLLESENNKNFDILSSYKIKLSPIHVWSKRCFTSNKKKMVKQGIGHNDHCL